MHAVCVVVIITAGKIAYYYWKVYVNNCVFIVSIPNNTMVSRAAAMYREVSKAVTSVLVNEGKGVQVRRSIGTAEVQQSF